MLGLHIARKRGFQSICPRRAAWVHGGHRTFFLTRFSPCRVPAATPDLNDRDGLCAVGGVGEALKSEVIMSASLPASTSGGYPFGTCKSDFR